MSLQGSRAHFPSCWEGDQQTALSDQWFKGAASNAEHCHIQVTPSSRDNGPLTHAKKTLRK